ncbi:MAG: cob(I)yrinic acid a,c-diamide adenosyltransferase [Pseudomonadota bacterium]
MVKLNKIYTKTGDDGTTGLVDGSRLPKHDLRIEAYGTVDELNAVIGVARLHVSGDMDQMLFRIQNDLFDLGADLATPGDDFEPSEMVLRMVPAQVARLEAEIDAINAELSPLTSFVLPGGHAAAAHLHQARTVARRAERIMSDAAGHMPINPAALHYINRLSDHLFVMARRANDGGAADILWVPGANRDT